MRDLSQVSVVTGQLGAHHATMRSLPIAAVALAAAVIVLVSTAHWGVGLSPDSVTYLTGARHIGTGKGYASWDGKPITLLPPLYPVILAAYSRTFGVSPVSAARIVAALLYGLTVFLSGLLLRKHLAPPHEFALLATAIMVVAPPLVRIALDASSEPLFICLVLLFLLSSGSYVPTGSGRLLLLFSLCAGMACLTRYVGFVLVLVGTVCILLSRRGRDPRGRILHLAIFLVATLVPAGIWLGRNYAVSSTLFGPRAPSALALPYNLLRACRTAASWYFPWRVVEHPVTSVVAGMAIALVVVGQALHLPWRGKGPGLSKGPLTLFTIAYVTLLVISSTTTAHDEIGDRLMVPVFVPTTLLLFHAVRRFGASLVRRFLSPGMSGLALLVGLAAWAVIPTRSTIGAVRGFLRNGSGYTGKHWRGSETIRYLAQKYAPGSATAVYSNDPYAIVARADVAAELAPGKRCTTPELWLTTRRA